MNPPTNYHVAFDYRFTNTFAFRNEVPFLKRMFLNMFHPQSTHLY